MERGKELLGRTPRRKIRLVLQRQATAPRGAGQVMGVVTESLVQLIAKQVDEKGLVVWYDPEQAYAKAAADISIPSATVARYDGSFFRLRKQIDHLLNDQQPPRLVVYLPIERTETHSAL